MNAEQKRFTKHLKEAVRIISKWPKWKRDAASSVWAQEKRSDGKSNKR